MTNASVILKLFVELEFKLNQDLALLSLARNFIQYAYMLSTGWVQETESGVIETGYWSMRFRRNRADINPYSPL